MSGSITGANTLIGISTPGDTIAGIASPPAKSDKNPRLVFINPINHPLRWLSWVRFSLQQSGD